MSAANKILRVDRDIRGLVNSQFSIFLWVLPTTFRQVRQEPVFFFVWRTALNLLQVGSNTVSKRQIHSTIKNR